MVRPLRHLRGDRRRHRRDRGPLRRRRRLQLGLGLRLLPSRSDGAADYGTQFRANNSADGRANRDADDRTYVPTDGTTHIGAVRFAHDRGSDVQSVTAAESRPLGRSDTHPDVRTIGNTDHRGTVLSTHDRRAVRVADDQPHVLADVRSVSVADGVP